MAIGVLLISLIGLAFSTNVGSWLLHLLLALWFVLNGTAVMFVVTSSWHLVYRAMILVGSVLLTELLLFTQDIEMVVVNVRWHLNGCVQIAYIAQLVLGSMIWYLIKNQSDILISRNCTNPTRLSFRFTLIQANYSMLTVLLVACGMVYAADVCERLQPCGCSLYAIAYVLIQTAVFWVLLAFEPNILGVGTLVTTVIVAILSAYLQHGLPAIIVVHLLLFCFVAIICALTVRAIGFTFVR